MIRLGPILTAHLARPWQSQARPDDTSRLPKILSPCRRLDVGRVGGPRGDGTSRRLVRVSALAALLHRRDPSIGEGHHNGSIASSAAIFVGADAVYQFRVSGPRWHHLSRHLLPEAASVEK